MGVRVAGSCLRLPSTAAAAATTPFPTSSSSSSQIVATISSHYYSTKRKARTHVSDLSVAYRIEGRSPFLGTRPGRLYRSRSLEIVNGERKKEQPLRRAVSADLQSFDEDEEEFVKKLQELVLGLQPGDADELNLDFDTASENQESVPSTSSDSGPVSPNTNQPWQASRFGASDWPEGRAIAIPASMERIANSVDLPVSLRIIKQKKKKQQLANWEEGLREAGESARCSVQKAFSSMVFMIRELQSYTLQMRQALFYEDIQGILGRVQQEMHASFVWLFQQIFSCTPTLMLSLMLLLANFTVYSMSHSVASAAPLPPPQCYAVAAVESNYEHGTKQPRFDQAAAVKTFSPGRAASVGGSGSGGGGKVRPVAGATDDGRSEGPSSSRKITPAGTPPTVAGDGDAEVGREEDEAAVWVRIVEEAKEMQASLRDESLIDPNDLKRLVAPVTVEVGHDDYSDYVETELRYQQAVKQDPENSLLLSNFAQFLQLVLHDNDG